jgi:hypothetical protein
MATDWELARTTGRCAATGRTFTAGEAYCAALFDTPAGLERRDYGLDAWSGPPEGSFCHWRGRIPVREKKPSAIEFDPQMLTQLFVGLEENPSETRQQFRFVLGLLLMRKRLLRLEGADREGEQEYWRLRLIADKSLHRLLNPRLTDEQIARLSAQLTALLSGEVEAIEFLEGTGDAVPELTASPPGEPSDEGHAAGEPETISN